LLQLVEQAKVLKLAKCNLVTIEVAFSGGAYSSKNVQGRKPYGRGILAGVEFGSDNLPQFRNRTSDLNGGNSGYFIYPTLRKHQPYLIAQWEEAFDKILKAAK